jgi:membrane protein implicated in regulation of membrane protease activity
MGLVYLFSLVVGLGVLVVQIAMGGKGDADGADAHGADAGADAHAGDALATPHAGAHGHALAKVPPGAGADVIAFLLSLRFWIFAALGFGLSGSLLHLFALAGPVTVFLLATATGLGSGFFAAWALRLAARSGASSTADVTYARGRIGRVLVPCGPNKVGQIRIELKGQSVDLLASTDEGEIARGEHVLIEEVEDGVARVSRRPPELV